MINNDSIPYSQKYLLTIKEASQYFGIGEKKIRQLIRDNPTSGLYVMNGVKYLLKRSAMEKYFSGTTSI